MTYQQLQTEFQGNSPISFGIKIFLKTIFVKITAKIEFQVSLSVFIIVYKTKIILSTLTTKNLYEKNYSKFYKEKLVF